jgi:PhnB protein
MNEEKKQMAPGKNGTVSAIIGLFTENVDGLVEKAVKAGATMLQPPITFEYNYRQAVIKDPFGHQWLIQKRV